MATVANLMQALHPLCHTSFCTKRTPVLQTPYMQLSTMNATTNEVHAMMFPGLSNT